MNNLAERFHAAHHRIRQAAEKYGRKESEITLLAVSKTKPMDAVIQAHACGQHQFGENYVQETVQKAEALASLPLEWHFIGPIQSNKTRLLAEHVNWVQTIDRIKIAQRLDAQRPAHLNPINICIQVNVSREPQKSGVLPEQLDEVVQSVMAMPNLTLRGLMAIPQSTQDESAQRAAFAQMHQLYSELQRQYAGIDTLSMGMSADLEAAIAEGSTMVRLGTALFGAR